jgi:hypothetical protein
VAIGAVVVSLVLVALVALGAIDQPRSPVGDVVAPPSQEAAEAPSASAPPATAEPAVSAG